jgi:acyl-CoA thioesterase FadM
MVHRAVGSASWVETKCEYFKVADISDRVIAGFVVEHIGNAAVKAGEINFRNDM